VQVVADPFFLETKKDQENALLKNEADAKRVVAHYAANITQIATHSVYNSTGFSIVSAFTS